MISGLVSVIVTCFNQENFIVRTLNSVLYQTFSNWECIIIDDESTDNSNFIIQNYIQEDKRFRLIRHSNRGLAASRNVGFQYAKGEFIQFLDGDDTFLPEKLEKQIAAFSAQKDAMICICDHQFYYERTKTYRYYQFEKIQRKPLDQFIYKWNNGVSFPPMAAIYKREIWGQHELPFQVDYPFWCEDWVLNVLLALRGFEYIILEEVLCNYHMHDTNFTLDKKKLVTSAIQAAIYLLPNLPPKYQTDFIDRTVENLLELYMREEKPKILMSSKNWRVANAVSKPFIQLLNKISF